MVATRKVRYDVDGLTMVAHLARPSGEGPWPAVLIGHDGIGLDDYQRRRADDLAAHGYVALAMDYHGGQLFFGRPDAMLARVMPLIADAERMRAIGRAALDALLAVPGVAPDRLAALGYGAGGSIVLEIATSGVPFRAVAAVHPSLSVASEKDWTDVTGTLLLCTGSEDPLCTPDQVLALGRVLQDAGSIGALMSTAGPSTLSGPSRQTLTGRPRWGPVTPQPPCPASGITQSTLRVHGERCSICSMRPLAPCPRWPE